MRRKNVIIPPEKELEAFALLDSISYSSLIKGYRDTPLVNNQGKFIEPISLDTLFELYLVDSDFSSLIFKNILHIEKILKTKIANNIAFHFGVNTSEDLYGLNNPQDYLCTNNYLKRPKTTATLKDLKKCIKHPWDDSTLSYYKEKKGKFPPWILADNIYFSYAFRWFKILKPALKNNIVQSFLSNDTAELEEKKELFHNAVNCLVHYRNKIAHRHMVFKINNRNKLTENILINYTSEKITNKLLLKKYSSRAFYLLILSIAILLNDITLYKEFMINLHSLLEKHKGISACGINIYELLGIPKEIIVHLLDYFEFLFENSLN